jgi:hypothetical protein
VPFMNNTTGADETALSIACRVSEERHRKARCKYRGESWEAKVGAGRAACRNACTHLDQQSYKSRNVTATHRR